MSHVYACWAITQSYKEKDQHLHIGGSTNVRKLISLFAKPPSIYVIVHFTSEGGCDAGDGTGNLYASYSPYVFYEDKSTDDESDGYDPYREVTITEMTLTVNVDKSVLFQPGWNKEYSCCSGWYRWYNVSSMSGKSEDYEEEYGRVIKFTYSQLNQKLRQQKKKYIRLG